MNLGGYLVGGEDQLIFSCENGRKCIFYHAQDCCEGVRIEDICGDLSNLVGAPLLRAEERTNNDETPDGIVCPATDDSYTWTFYEFATIKGSVTVRWLGESNGYYSESVSLQVVEPTLP